MSPDSPIPRYECDLTWGGIDRFAVVVVARRKMVRGRRRWWKKSRGEQGRGKKVYGAESGGFEGPPLAAFTQVGAPVGRLRVRPLAVRAHRPSSSFLPRLLLGISRISSGATRATGLSPVRAASTRPPSAISLPFFPFLSLSLSFPPSSPSLSPAPNAPLSLPPSFSLFLCLLHTRVRP